MVTCLTTFSKHIHQHGVGGPILYINDYKQHQFSGEFPLELFCVLLGFGLLSENKKKVISFFIFIVSCSGWDVFNFWVQMVFQLNQYNWLEIGCSLDSKLSDIKLCFGFLKLLSMIYGLDYSTNTGPTKLVHPSVSRYWYKD